MQRLIITIDGPAGSGKSSVARKLAGRLGVAFLDTGAMYRAVTAAALDANITPADQPDRCVEIARQCDMRFDFTADPPRLYIFGDRDVTPRLRDLDVNEHVSDVAAITGVRQVLVKTQQRIGEEHPRLVTEGRDQGSVVFPDATIKFFLDASAEVRAERRFKELKEAGVEVDQEAILANVIERDRKDSSRADGPLTCPDDALRIDTSPLTLNEVVDRLEQEVRSRTDAAAQPADEPRA